MNQASRTHGFPPVVLVTSGQRAARLWLAVLEIPTAMRAKVYHGEWRRACKHTAPPHNEGNTGTWRALVGRLGPALSQRPGGLIRVQLYRRLAQNNAEETPWMSAPAAITTSMPAGSVTRRPSGARPRARSTGTRPRRLSSTRRPAS